jgi:ADP-ribose pyrophosphatase
MHEKTIGTQLIYDGTVINVRRDEAQMPDGQIAAREVVEHPGGVGIALEDEEGKFFMVKQYRYAQKEVTLEFPAGKKERGEDPFTTAQREVIEETGYEGTDWVYLGKMYPTPAYDNEVIDMYYARKGSFKGQHLDSDEFLNVYRYTLDEIEDMITDGKIPDAKTMGMALLIDTNRRRGKI